MRNEFVKLGLSHKVLEMEEKVEPLLVRDTGEGIVRVLALQIDHQLSEFMVVAKAFNGISERLPANDG